MATDESRWGHYRLTRQNDAAVRRFASATNRKLNAVVNMAVEEFLANNQTRKENTNASSKRIKRR